MVTPVRCAEDGRGRGQRRLFVPVDDIIRHGHGYALLGTRGWLPQEEFLCITLGQEEGAAVAAVKGPPGAGVRSGEGEGRRGGGGEVGNAVVVTAVEEAEHGGCPVELVEAAAESGGGDGATPGLADEGGAEEAGRVVGREAEEDLFEDLVRDRRRRCRHGGGR